MNPTIEPEVLLNLETMIKDYLVDIRKTQEKIKTQKEMFKQSFEQDAGYAEVEEQQKEVKRQVAAAKDKIVKTEAVQAVETEIRSLSEDLRELQTLLSENLNHYANMTQKNEFTGPDGEVLKIVRTAKLVKPRD
jgi:predicted  nucleic acid-binding Zn-ribbon protein